MEKKIFYNPASVIIGSFPILFITGPLLTDLFCIILGLLFFAHTFTYKTWKEFFYQNKTYINFFLIFYIYLNINSFFSFNQKISFLSSIPFLRICFFVFALAYFISNQPKIYKIFYRIFFLSILCLLVDSVMQSFFGLNILRDQVIHENRISSFFGEELIMGSYVSRLLPIALASSFFINLKNKYKLNFMLLILSGMLIVLSGERLAVIYYLGIIFIYFLITKKYVLKFSFFIILISIISILFKPTIIDRLYYNTKSQISQHKSIFSYRHTLHFKTAHDMFLDKKLFGHGLKSFRYKCSDKIYEDKIKEKQSFDIQKFKIKENEKHYITEFKNGCNTHPHNIYLEYLSELGLFGIVFLITIFVYSSSKLFFYLYRNLIFSDKNELSLGKILILSGIFFQLFPLLTSGSYFNNWMLIIFHLSIGFYLSSMKKE